MSICPYPDTLLDYWEGISQPLGDWCYNCLDYDCLHNVCHPTLEDAYPDQTKPPRAAHNSAPNEPKIAH